MFGAQVECVPPLACPAVCRRSDGNVLASRSVPLALPVLRFRSHRVPLARPIGIYTALLASIARRVAQPFGWVAKRQDASGKILCCERIRIPGLHVPQPNSPSGLTSAIVCR